MGTSEVDALRRMTKIIEVRRGCSRVPMLVVGGWLLLACQASSSDHVHSDEGIDATTANTSAFDASASDASMVDASAGDAGDSVGCLDHTIHWGSLSGWVTSSTVFTLEPCRNYSASDPQNGQAPMLLCANEVPLDATITADDIDALVASADVVTALANAPIFYGTDSRLVDGSVQHIEVDGAIVEIGGPCSDATSCLEIPAGIAVLRDALDSLALQQRRVVPNCLGTN